MSIRLKNQTLCVVVRPERGGRIDQISDLACGKDWLWHPAAYVADNDAPAVFASSFDASWSGGFEEIFPNDVAGEVEGRSVLDHGELWSARWQVEEQDENHVSLSMACATVPVRVEKTVTLDAWRPELTLRYRLDNLSSQRVPFMLKLHPALHIEEGDEIELPDCLVEPVDLSFSRIIGLPGQTRWPRARAADGSEVWLNRIAPAASGLREFFYCSELASGVCSISNTRSGSRFELRFQRADFPCVWVFVSSGGFHGHQVAMLQPCTGKPWDLNVAIAQGTAAWLEPEESRVIELSIVLGSS